MLHAAHTPMVNPPLLRTGSIQRDRGELPGPLPVTGGSPATWTASVPCTVLRSKARYPEGATRGLREHTLLCPVAWYTRGRWDSFPLVVIIVVVVVVVVLPSTLKHVQHALERLGLSNSLYETSYGTPLRAHSRAVTAKLPSDALQRFTLQYHRRFRFCLPGPFEASLLHVLAGLAPQRSPKAT